jgi:hypothetical protein
VGQALRRYTGRRTSSTSSVRQEVWKGGTEGTVSVQTGTLQAGDRSLRQPASQAARQTFTQAISKSDRQVCRQSLKQTGRLNLHHIPTRTCTLPSFWFETATDQAATQCRCTPSPPLATHTHTQIPILPCPCMPSHSSPPQVQPAQWTSSHVRAQSVSRGG